MATTQTQQATLTPVMDQTPVVVNLASELSGPQWITRFLGSNSTNDLIPAFKSAVDSFIAALKIAGAFVHISATFRPPERAFLMHYSSAIARGDIAPSAVPEMNGVHIEWVHPTNQQSVQKARQMANGYGVVYPPALVSRHTQRRAIDMTITNVLGKTVKNAIGSDILVNNQITLHAVGRTYGVIKLVSDPPHWSDDGH